MCPYMLLANLDILPYWMNIHGYVLCINYMCSLILAHYGSMYISVCSMSITASMKGITVFNCKGVSTNHFLWLNLDFMRDALSFSSVWWKLRCVKQFSTVFSTSVFMSYPVYYMLLVLCFLCSYSFFLVALVVWAVVLPV